MTKFEIPKLWFFENGFDSQTVFAMFVVQQMSLDGPYADSSEEDELQQSHL
jgi:hypothetical protein